MSAAGQQCIVVTGASDGIGLEAASQLAAQGHQVVLIGRTPSKLDAAVARIRKESPGVPVDSYVCDFASLAEVRRLAASLLASYPRIDVLISNAGAAFDDRVLTVDGYESTFAVNHLAGFLLVELLLPRLVASTPARIVITSSVGHYRGSMDFDDLGYEQKYGVLKAYGRSKLANALHTRDLAERLTGTGVTANCLHPGSVATNIWSGAPGWAKPILDLAKRIAMVSPAEGGARLTFLATDPAVEGASGGYYEKDREKAPAKLAQDDVVRHRLMAVSRELVDLPPTGPAPGP